MPKRKPLSATVRWQIFARDNFTCRYCGAQAGEESVSLQVDHLVAVADGGDNSMDNLVTACQRCNAGKGARSMEKVPAEGVSERTERRAELLQRQADAIQQAIDLNRESRQLAVDLKCSAYGRDSVEMAKGEEQRIISWCRKHGADVVQEWYGIACQNDVAVWNAVRYVSGIVRNVEKEQAE